MAMNLITTGNPRVNEPLQVSKTALRRSPDDVPMRNPALRRNLRR